jgi:hypothetical protein
MAYQLLNSGTIEQQVYPQLSGLTEAEMVAAQCGGIALWNRCARCGGTMIEAYSDLLSPNNFGEDTFGWRCINCGNYLDRQVIENRSTQTRSSRAISRARRMAGREEAWQFKLQERGGEDSGQLPIDKTCPSCNIVSAVAGSMRRERGMAVRDRSEPQPSFHRSPRYSSA